jgi:uncharacterized protein (TIGR01639 family)
LHTATLPINHSFTYLSITDKELGIIIDGGNNVISKDDMSDLWAIANSLERHKKNMTATTIVDLLFTSDGVGYRLFKSYIDHNYRIVKL